MRAAAIIMNIFFLLIFLPCLFLALVQAQDVTTARSSRDSMPTTYIGRIPLKSRIPRQQLIIKTQGNNFDNTDKSTTDADLRISLAIIEQKSLQLEAFQDEYDARIGRHEDTTSQHIQKINALLKIDVNVDLPQPLAINSFYVDVLYVLDRDHEIEKRNISIEDLSRALRVLGALRAESKALELWMHNFLLRVQA